MPITIEPVKGTFKKREPNELFDCGKAGACSKDLKEIAPEELKVEKDGKVVAVQSACAKFGTDEYCCTGKPMNVKRILVSLKIRLGYSLNRTGCIPILYCLLVF